LGRIDSERKATLTELRLATKHFVFLVCFVCIVRKPSAGRVQVVSPEVKQRLR
jgi:hypothetical protein